MSGEFHVAGILVQAVPARAEAVGAAISVLPGAEVHARADGKLVVTLESEGAAPILAALDGINAMKGVISAVLVYQHSEPLDSLDEEVVYGRQDHAP